jgi:glycogen debranching enzyme
MPPGDDTAFDTEADAVPTVGGADALTLVDGRTFVISRRSGDLGGQAHGLVVDDRRHLSRFTLTVPGQSLETLASTSPNPLAAVIVQRVIDTERSRPASCLVIRRRWIAGGMRDEIEVRQTASRPSSLDIEVALGADFAHVFDVKGGLNRAPGRVVDDDEGWMICPVDLDDVDVATRVRWSPAAMADPETGTLRWRAELAEGGSLTINITVVAADSSGSEDADSRFNPSAEAVPVYRVAGWRQRAPSVVSTDPRLGPAIDRALSDLASLRIVDPEHPDRALIAAGAPWFMTLFGRDSLLTALMTLSFDPDLAKGVLGTLADLQGTSYDATSDEQPGKIVHELRRHGSDGMFSARQRYYGTVDATALFVILVAEAWRWGALARPDLEALDEAVQRAVTWLVGDGDGNGDGWIDYRRETDVGLSNQGWKDSWDGITFADGSLPEPPIAVVEVQGYTYAALLAAAELETFHGRDAAPLRRRAARLRERFNETFWDPRGWFVLGLDGDGRRIDALASNPGHALWTGIADADLAARYLEWFADESMWSGWGIRTLASTMGAFDPLSYHNGSVWPHDTAICAAGAARYGRWDLVDQILDAALDAAVHFGGRPPELFAGLSRTDVPAPVAYPASCSPQAWSSASLPFLLRTSLGLQPNVGTAGLSSTRSDLSSVADVSIGGLFTPRGRADVRVHDGVIDIEPSPIATRPERGNGVVTSGG